jgi:hypothetical protein
MVHHAAPGEVVAAIAEVARSGRGAQVQKSSLPSEPAASIGGPMPCERAEAAMLANAPRRHWLHIGEGLVAA